MWLSQADAAMFSFLRSKPGKFPLAGARVEFRIPETVPEGTNWFRAAAADLTNALYLVTGVASPLVEEGSQKPSSSVPTIYLGDTLAAAKAKMSSATLKRAAFRIRVKGNRAFVLANTGMGASYGVSYFLSEFLDVWAPTRDGRLVHPEADPARAVAVCDFVREPGVYYRKIYDGRFALNDGVTDAHLRRGMPKTYKLWRNWERRNYFYGVDDEYENSERMTRQTRENHSSFEYLPPAKYFKEHPEWYSMRKDGRRHAEPNAGGQLCYSNPEALDKVVETMLGFIAADRAANPNGRHPTIYDFSQLDNAGGYFCCCPGCKAVMAKYDAKKGGMADGGTTGLQFEFVNALARRVREKYPDVVVRTFAYTCTETLPANLVLEPNVMVQFCDIYSKCDNLRPLDKGPFNPARLDLMKSWAKAATRFEIWDYMLHGSRSGAPAFPEVNVDAISGDARIMREIGVGRYFLETEFYNSCFYDLDTFVAGQAYFNPDRDVEQLVDVYCRSFGPSAGLVRRAVDFLRALERDNPPATAWDWHGRILPWLKKANLEKFRALVREAYAATPAGPARALLAGMMAAAESHMVFMDRMRPGPERDAMQAECLAHLDEQLSAGAYEDPERERWGAGAKKSFSGINLKFTDLPSELSSVPEAERVLVNHVSMYGEGKPRRKDPDAQYGTAYFFTRGKVKTPIAFDVYDIQTKARNRLFLDPPQELRDGKYHWFKLGVGRLGRDGQICFPADWAMKFVLRSFYIECDGLDSDPNWYEFWISMKFSPDMDYFAADRLFLRRVPEPAGDKKKGK